MVRNFTHKQQRCGAREAGYQLVRRNHGDNFLMSEKGADGGGMKNLLMCAILLLAFWGLGNKAHAQPFTVTESNNYQTTYPNALTAVYESAQKIGSIARNGGEIIYRRFNSNENDKIYYKYQGETYMGYTFSKSDANIHLGAWEKAYVFCSDGYIYGARINGTEPHVVIGENRGETATSCASKFTIPLSYWLHSMTATIDLSNTAYVQNTNYPENFYVYGALGWNNGYVELGFIKAPDDPVWKLYIAGMGYGIQPTGKTYPLNSILNMEWRLEYDQYKCIVNGEEVYNSSTSFYGFSCIEENIRTQSPRFFTMTSMCPDYGINPNPALSGNNKITNMSDGSFLGPVKWSNCQINYISGHGGPSNFWTTDGITAEANFVSDHTCQVIPYAGSETITLSRNGSFSPTRSITTSSSPSGGGSAAGGGTKTIGTPCTVTAQANSGYTFSNWTENGSIVSYSTNYTFTVTDNRTLVANFTSTPPQPGCLSGTLWPSSTFTPSCTGSNETIRTDCYAGEYSLVSVTNGTSYTFSSSNSSDFITIANSAGTSVLAYGTSPVTWTATSSTNVRFYTHTNSSCGTENTNRSRLIRCNPPPPSNDQCANATNLPCGTTLQGTLTGATPTNNITYQRYPSSNDVFYYFTASANGSYKITLNNFSDDKDLLLYSSCSVTGELALSDGNGSTETITYSCVAGTTYRVRVTDYTGTGGTFNIKLDCSQPDIYEPNDTQSQSANRPVNFADNSAIVNTDGSNFHTNTDIDYYKIELPSCYNYTVTSRLHDSYNSGNGQTYTVDAKFSVAVNAGGFSSTYDTYYNNTNGGNFSVTNGGTVYFKVEPYVSGNTGTYLLDINVTRTPTLFTVSPDNYNFPQPGGTSSPINVTSCQSWTVSSSDPSWLIVTPSSGSFTMSATPNLSTSSRAATVTVTSNGETKTVNVTQDPLGPPSLQVLALAPNGPLYYNQTGSFTATLKNNGDTDYNSMLWIYLEKPNIWIPSQWVGDGDIFYIAAGATQTITITGIITVPPDLYNCNMIFDVNNDPDNVDLYQFNNIHNPLGVQVTVLYPPPPNDLCANAINLPCGETKSGTFAGATPTTNYEEQTYQNDVFYKFTAVYSGNHTITYTKFSFSEDINLFLYPNDCNSTAFNDKFTQAYNNPNSLTQTLTYFCSSGTTYLVRITDFKSLGCEFYIKLDCPTFNSWQIGKPNLPDVIATLNGGIFTITPTNGTSAMIDWKNESERPWHSLANDITDVKILDGVTNIGNYIFQNCQYLNSVSIPNSVVDIGDLSFDQCSILPSVDLPDNLQTIGEWAFSGIDITSIVIPKSVKYIGREAFGWLSGILTDFWVNWDEPLQLQPPPAYNPFAPYTNVTDINLHVPPGTECLYSEADVWQDFNIIGLPLTITAIATGNGAISPNGTDTVTCGESTFYSFYPVGNCFEIDEVLIDGIPDSFAKENGYYFFPNITASHIIEVIFVEKLPLTIIATVTGDGSIDPLGTTTLNCGGSQTYTFAPNGCNAVVQVLIDGIPVSDFSNNSYTFENVTENHTIEVKFSTTIQWQIGEYNPVDVIATLDFCNSTLTITGTNTGVMHDFGFQGTPWWDPDLYRKFIATLIIEDGVTTIGTHAFDQCNNLTSVSEFPNSVISVGDYAFSNCYGLETIQFLNSVTSLGEGCFFYCTDLLSIEIPGSVESIGPDAFSGCSSLQDIYVEWLNPLFCTVAPNAFDGCGDLKNINLHVPPGTECLYKSHPVWGQFNILNLVPAQPGNIIGEESVCVGETLPYYILDEVPDYISYEWSVPDGWDTMAVDKTIIVVTFGPDAESGCITVTATNGCEDSVVQEFCVNVYQTPEMVPIDDITVCDDDPVEVPFANVGDISGVTYEWHWVGGADIGAPMNGTDNSLIFNAVNLGNVPIVAVYGVQAINGVCESDEIFFTITVAPHLVFNSIIPTEMVYCNSTQVPAYIFDGTYGAICHWERIDMPGGANIGDIPDDGIGPLPTFMTANDTDDILTAHFTVWIEYQNNDGSVCSGESNAEYFSISVLPTATIDINAIPKEFCSSEYVSEIQFEGNIPGTSLVNVSYEWEHIGGDDIGTEPSGTNTIPTFLAVDHFGATPLVALYEVTAFVEYGGVICAGTTYYFSLTVNPKLLEPISPIEGNSTVCAGESAWYYILPVPGATHYDWEVPAVGWNIDIDLDFLIFVTLDPDAEDGDIIVTAYNDYDCDPSSLTSTLEVTVMTVPEQPSITASPSIVCGGTQSTFYITSYIPDVIYIWNLPYGWHFYFNNGVAFTFDIDSDAQSGYISVTAYNECGGSEASDPWYVTVAPAPQSSQIEGEVSVCTGGTHCYSVPPVSEAIYDWILPDGWNIISDYGFLICVTLDSNAQSGVVSVTVDNGCGLPVTNTLEVTVNTVPPQPEEIFGGDMGTCISPGINTWYSIPEVPGATSYTWDVQCQGWHIMTEIENFLLVTLDPDAESCCISVTANNECGSSLKRELCVTVGSAPAQPEPISGPTCVYADDNAQYWYSIPPVPGAVSYDWDVQGGQIFYEADTFISIIMNPDAQQCCISVTASNDCGDSPASELCVYIVPAQPGPIAGETIVCTDDPQTYSIEDVPGATEYAWEVPSDWTIISGQGSTEISVIPMSDGCISVMAINGSCYGPIRELCVLCPPTDIDEIEAGTLKIYPNPVRDVLTIEFEDANLATEVVKIYDLLGRESVECKLSDGKINVSQLAPGAYILKIGDYTVKFVKE